VRSGVASHEPLLPSIRSTGNWNPFFPNRPVFTKNQIEEGTVFALLDERDSVAV
jgi:hypothetical protein